MTVPRYDPIEGYRSASSNLIGIYADQKAGKSCSLTTLPKDWTLYVVDLDGRFEPAIRLWRESGHPMENLHVVTPGTYNEVHEALYSMPPGFNVYALDNYTHAMKVFKDYVTQGKPDVPVNIWGGRVSGMAIDYFFRFREQVYTQNAWGVVTCQEKQRESGTAHVETIDGPQSAKRFAMDLIGASVGAVQGLVNFLFHLEHEVYPQTLPNRQVVRSIRRVLRTEDHGLYIASDGSGALDAIEPVDLAGIISKITASRKAITNLQAKETQTP